jgi:glycosyltransferase involved in cell wall biosynthesis
VRARLPIQVIQCADYGGPYRGSFVPMLAAVSREAADRGYPCRIVLSDIARDRPWLADLEELAELSFVSPSNSRRGLIGNAMSALRFALGSRHGPAVIHSHFATFDIPAALMRLRRRNLAVFWHEHGPVLDDPRVRRRNTLRYVSLGRLVNGMLCVSPEIRAELRARHAPAGRLYDFPNAVDTDTFAPITAPERRAARRSLGLPDQARVVLHFGWSWERKGGDLMVAAAGILAPECNLVMLTVLGEDGGSVPGVDGPSIVRPLGPTNDVRRLYAAADVFLSCGRAEGMPLALLEALGCGLPVVATDLPVQRRTLEGLPSAVTVFPDPAAIAAGLREILAHSDQTRAEHSRAARARIVERFALGAWARRAVDLYETAVAPAFQS